MDDADWIPPDVDRTKPSAARLYDFYLDGSHNFAADREMGRKMLAIAPQGKVAARANRDFLGRAVGYMVDAGIRQFIDLGSGIPTHGNVHEVAQQAAPEARVVYVDNDPVAVAHSRALLAGNDRAAVIQGDMRWPDEILQHPTTAEMIDFERPVGILLVAVLHFVTDDEDPAGIVAGFHWRASPGSHVAVCHFTSEANEQHTAALERLYEHSAVPLRARTRPEIEAMLTGLDLVEPGLVWIPEWRRDGAQPPGEPADYLGLVAVGRKP